MIPPCHRKVVHVHPPYSDGVALYDVLLRHVKNLLCLLSVRGGSGRVPIAVERGRGAFFRWVGCLPFGLVTS